MQYLFLFRVLSIRRGVDLQRPPTAALSTDIVRQNLGSPDSAVGLSDQ